VKIEAVDAFARHLLVVERSDGMEQLRTVRLSDGTDHVIAQPEPAYALNGETSPEWDTDVARFGYSSLVRPPSSIDYDLERAERTIVKETTVGGGFHPDGYHTQRLWAEAGDGARVPAGPRRQRPVPALRVREL